MKKKFTQFTYMTLSVSLLLIISQCSSVTMPDTGYAVSSSKQVAVASGDLATGSLFVKADVRIQDNGDNGATVDTAGSRYRVEVQDFTKTYSLDILKSASISPGGALTHDPANSRFDLSVLPSIVPATDFSTKGYSVTADAGSYGSISFDGSMGSRAKFTSPVSSATTITGSVIGTDTFYKITWTPSLDNRNGKTLELKITDTVTPKNTGWFKIEDTGTFYLSKKDLTVTKALLNLTACKIELRRTNTITMYPSPNFITQIGELNLEWITSVTGINLN